MAIVEFLNRIGHDGLDRADIFYGFTRCASPVGRRSKSPIICTCHGDKSICIRTEDGRVCNKLENDYSTSINCICVDNSSIWVGFSNGLINIYDIRNYSLLHRRKENSGGILCMTYSPILDNVFTGGHGWEILKWSCKQHVKIKGANLSGHTNAVRSLVNEMNYLYSSSDDGSIRCWDVFQNNGKNVWASDLSTQHPQNIVIDGDYLVCLTQQGILILSKHNGNRFRFIDAGGNKLSLLMKDVRSDSVWVADSAGIVTVYGDSSFAEKQILIVDEKKSPVSSITPISQKCDVSIFAKQDATRSNDFSPSLVRIYQSNTNIDFSINNVIIDTCQNMIDEYSKIVSIQHTSRCLSSSIDEIRNKIFLLHQKHENRTFLHQYYRQLLRYAKRHVAHIRVASELYKKGLRISKAHLHYSLLYENMLFQVHRAKSPSLCKLNRLRTYHYFQKLYSLSQSVKLTP